VTKIASIQLDDDLSDFVAAQVAAGRYADPDEAIAAAVRLLKEQEAALDDLRAEIRKGEESGWIEDFDFDAWIEEKMRAYGA
jgi:antitoxin ParD1/3/4